MRKKAILALGLTLFFSACINSVMAQKTAFTVEAGSIPPEFNQNNDTLLILASNPFYGASMKKHFRKGGYEGEYITVTKPNKYSVEHCRYVLYEISSRTTITNIGGPSNNMSHDMIQTEGFYINDRKTGKNYVNNNMPMPKLIHAYVAALDAARKK